MAQDGQSLKSIWDSLSADALREMLSQPIDADRYRSYYEQIFPPTLRVRTRTNNRPPPEPAVEPMPASDWSHLDAVYNMTEQVNRSMAIDFGSIRPRERYGRVGEPRFTRVDYGLDHAIDKYIQPPPEAIARAKALLIENLSPEQRELFLRAEYFEVVGGDTGQRYRLFCSSQTFNIYLIAGPDKKSRAGRMCVAPPLALNLPIYDVVLAQKFALELYETETLARANYDRGGLWDDRRRVQTAGGGGPGPAQIG